MSVPGNHMGSPAVEERVGGPILSSHLLKRTGLLDSEAQEALCWVCRALLKPRRLSPWRV